MTTKRILVADDSLTIQKVIRLALSNEGYEIHAVADGNEVIQQVSLFRPDIVLVDVSLPGKTAFEIKRELNEQEDFKTIRFILMSSAFEKVDEAQVQAVQFHGRLTKPFDPAFLRQVLIDVLEQVPNTSENKPFLPPPPLEELQDLWSSEEAEIHSPPPPPPPLSTQPPPFPSAETDIRELTESTIKISGLENNEQWNISEPLISPPPPPQVSTRVSDAEQTISHSSLTEKEMESIVRELTQKILPDIAERIVKQEIHRLLNEAH